MKMPLLQVADLSTYFETDQGVARAVDGISFSVAEGETLALVGESGCGKTVTALSIIGLVPDPPGRVGTGSSVRLRGEELVGASEERMRRLRGNEISMIFQEPMTSLNPVFTVGEQLGEPLRLHQRISARQARDRVIELLREVQIPEPARRFGEYPHQLSGGMRQRVMIAMALACEPALLVADEPTTALDVTIQAQILELLAELRERRGMAVLLITHDLGVVAEVADRVVVMYAGQVAETGSVREVFASPTHPYTKGLLGSIPQVGRTDERLRPIPGVVLAPTEWPSNCRFARRCPYAWERCHAVMPPVIELVRGRGAERTARCWLVDEPGRRRTGVESLS